MATPPKTPAHPVSSDPPKLIDLNDSRFRKTLNQVDARLNSFFAELQPYISELIEECRFDELDYIAECLLLYAANTKEYIRDQQEDSQDTAAKWFLKQKLYTVIEKILEGVETW
jgi:hypothetical protein